ncbi:MAG TPA: AMP-binding protein [Xanthobacteraceae bacterium]|jgi:fatty-acyl-CoA synthase|nr:AMP-binding protein [Xanthobacteraceae bacterium]
MATRLTLTAILDRHVTERPRDIALIADRRTVTYAEFDRLSRKTASWLVEQGIKPGDRVAVWMVNRIEWLALLFGCARIGAALVAVNTRFRATELGHILDRSGARMLVLQPGFKAIEFLGILEGVAASAARALEGVAVIGKRRGLPDYLLERPIVAFDAFEMASIDIADRSDPEAPVALFTTSGTTRGPKLVVHRQRSLAWHAGAVASLLGFTKDACLLAALPFCGVFGLDSMLGAFAGGASAVIMETFDGAEAAQLMRRHRVTHVFGSDEMARRLIESAEGYNPFPSLRLFGFAAFQPGAIEMAKLAYERRIPMTGLYGSSEVQALFAAQPSDLDLDRRIEAGGRPVPGSKVRVRNLETGALAPVGESGEIEIWSPSNFDCYLNDKEGTAAALTSDGFFKTSDIGRLRDDGTFVFEARSGDAIRLGGFLVNPIEIEDMLKHVEGVADAQVVGVEMDGKMRCVGFVVPENGALDEADLIARLTPLMAPFKVPARIWFVDEFPTTPSANGTKIQRNKLRDMAVERLRQVRAI